MNRILLMSFYFVTAVLASKATYAASNTSEQVQLLNTQIQAQLQKIQSNTQDQIKTLNTQIQNQLKQMNDNLQKKMDELNTRTQGQLKEMHESMQKQLHELQKSQGSGTTKIIEEPPTDAKPEKPAKAQ